MLTNIRNYIPIRDLNIVTYLLWSNFIKKTTFIPLYYIRNELIWQDGFLFDFLQKKTIDLWVRKFLIYTGFLFSERLVFESIIRLYIDNLIWLGHNINMFEPSNISDMLNTLLFMVLTVLLMIFGASMLYF